MKPLPDQVETCHCNIVATIFRYVPPAERAKLRAVSKHWKFILDRMVGFGVTIASQTVSTEPQSNNNEEAPVNLVRPISIITILGISDCKIGLLARNAILPKFKAPHLLKNIVLQGDMTTRNFKNSFRFRHLANLKVSVETLNSLKMGTMDLALPELRSLDIYFECQKKKTIRNEIAKALVGNVAALLQEKRFEKLKRLDFQFFCFMSPLDADVRNGLFRFLLNHKETLKTANIRLEFLRDLPEEKIIEKDKHLISNQAVIFSEEQGPPALSTFQLSFEKCPLNGTDCFGFQVDCWTDFTKNLNSLDVYTIDCWDEFWSDECRFEDYVHCDFIPNKPLLPKDLLLKNSTTLRNLYLSIRTWDHEHGMLETLDFADFADCSALQELTLVGQWHEEMVGFIEVLDSNFPTTENLDKLPVSLKVFKSSFILYHQDDISELLNRNFQELHLKYFGLHGGYHNLQGESLAVTSFNGNFAQLPFLSQTLSNSEAILTKIELTANKFLAREGDTARRTILDAYPFRNCVNLKEFSLEGMEFEDYVMIFDVDSDKEEPILLQNLISPTGINRIQYFPKSVEVLRFKNVFLQANHFRFFVKELKKLRVLNLEQIGQFNNFGVTPKVIWELLMRNRILKLSLHRGLNWRAWESLRCDYWRDFKSLETTYPLLAKILVNLPREKYLRLELDPKYDTNYNIAFED